MVRFIPLTKEEYQSYINTVIDELPKEFIRAGVRDQKKAIRQTKEQIERILPNGLETPNNFLYSILDKVTSNKVGILWYEIREKEGIKHAFICDISINKNHRRKGYGTQAFQVLEKEVKNKGLSSIKLHVFGHNKLAIKLYKKLGYKATNVLMSKDLSVNSQAV